MLLSKSAEYGIQAVLHIAVHEKDGPVLMRQIADEWEMPLNYVHKTLAQLTRVGILNSTRGVGGGYVLAKPPDEITCLEIVEGVEGPLKEGPRPRKRAKTAYRSKQKYIAFRQDIFRSVRSGLAKTTIKQLMS